MPYDKPALRGAVTDAIRLGCDPLLEPMHRRLVDYGLCWLRAGGDTQIVRRQIIQHTPGDAEDPENLSIVPTNYRDPDPDRKARQWTRIEIDNAGKLHSRIIRLPLKVHALTIQVFYSETCAAEWASVLPNQKADILRDLTFWPSAPYGVNARLRRYGAETGQKVPPIRADEFVPIMLRGIRMLVNGERMTG